jgi:surfeit locus 1 family protein
MARESVSHRRRPALVPALAALVTVALCVAAGVWQHGRMEQKLALRAQLDAASRSAPVALPATEAWASWRYRPVRVTGTFDGAQQILIDNRIRAGRVGYDVVAPLRLADGRVVMVDRGWVPARATRDDLPSVQPPAGEVTVEGRINVPSSAYLELAKAKAQGRVWQNLDLARFREATGIAVLPVIVEETGAADDGLVRERPAPDTGVAKHMIYRAQWFTFAALAAGLWAWFTWRRKRKTPA